MLVDRGHKAGQHHEELQVVLGMRSRLEQVPAVGRDRPVVVLARAVHVLEGLLVLQARQAVVGGEELQLLHREQVVVDGERALLEDGGELVLAGGHLVVLGLGRDRELPELVVELLHEGVDRGADGAEVVLFELLALGGCRPEEGAAAQPQVRTRLEVLLADQEVLLLEADGGDDAMDVVAEEGQHALGLALEGDLGAQERGLLVEGLAGVGDEGRGDAEHLVLDEGGARGVPDGVAPGLEGGPKASRGEARGVGLALDELLAAERHQHAAVVERGDEAVVLLARDAVERLEPVGEVGRALLEGPLLHRVGDLVGDVEVDGLVVLDDARELVVRRLGEPLAHVQVGEDQAAVLSRYLVLCHDVLSVVSCQEAL